MVFNAGAAANRRLGVGEVKRRQPLRQPRGPRATLPRDTQPLPPCGYNPHPELPGGAWAAHNGGVCACWHQYKDCCDRADHRLPHLAATCPCTTADQPAPGSD